MVCKAQRAVSGENMKRYEGIVKMVNARTYWRDTNVSPRRNRAHYNHNADTYMDVGNALGWAMVDLLFNATEYIDKQCIFDEDAAAKYHHKNRDSISRKCYLKTRLVDDKVIIRSCSWLKEKRPGVIGKIRATNSSPDR